MKKNITRQWDLGGPPGQNVIFEYENCAIFFFQIANMYKQSVCFKTSNLQKMNSRNKKKTIQELNSFQYRKNNIKTDQNSSGKVS